MSYRQSKEVRPVNVRSEARMRAAKRRSWPAAVRSKSIRPKGLGGWHMLRRAVCACNIEETGDVALCLHPTRAVFPERRFQCGPRLQAPLLRRIFEKV